MSDTAAAIRAAREVQADTLAPELFRQANEWFFKAKNEYKFKNFEMADDYAQKARRYAEQAEFTSIQSGGSRSDQTAPDPLSNVPLGNDQRTEGPLPPNKQKTQPTPQPDTSPEPH